MHIFNHADSSYAINSAHYSSPVPSAACIDNMNRKSHLRFFTPHVQSQLKSHLDHHITRVTLRHMSFDRNIELVRPVAISCISFQSLQRNAREATHSNHLPSAMSTTLLVFAPPPPSPPSPSSSKNLFIFGLGYVARPLALSLGKFYPQVLPKPSTLIKFP